ncbi:MAG: AI-2E family transporter [Holophaga sp.]|nr:AI-2E family transporter [Holophaga sp.]
MALELKPEWNPESLPPPPVPERLPSADHVAQTLRFELSLTTILTLVLVAASVWLLIRLAPILLVLIVALLVVGTMSPAVTWLEAHRIRRGLGITLVFSALFVSLVLIVTLTIPSLVSQAAALFEREPVFRKGLANYLGHYHLSAPLAEWLRNLKYGGPGNTLGATAFAYSLRIFEIMAYGLSSIFLAVYMMIDRDRLRGGLFAIVPRAIHIRLSRVMLNLETIVGAYIRGQLLTCMLIGIFTFVLLTTCGVENAMALAVFAAVADILPYIGGLLSVGPAVLAALGHSPTAAVIVLVMMLAYEEFESRVLVPRIYGRALRLPSSVVLFALMAGGVLMGLLGALLALPLAATIMMLIEELRVELPGEQEQTTDTALRAGDDLAEQEYERRTEGVGALEASAIAVEISADRRFEESHPHEDGNSETLGSNV